MSKIEYRELAALDFVVTRLERTHVSRNTPSIEPI